MNFVNYFREVKGMTQKELADKSGINIRQIQKYESGEYNAENMTLKNAVALADALGCEPKDFLPHYREKMFVEILRWDEKEFRVSWRPQSSPSHIYYSTNNFGSGCFKINSEENQRWSASDSDDFYFKGCSDEEILKILGKIYKKYDMAQVKFLSDAE